ncbi:copper transporter, partial [Pseudonocardia lacus]|uniref:copper transporter n=1 Tax=Pseudonocardia lacus TaxID=2835865 RepID=UPI001BDDB785
MISLRYHAVSIGAVFLALAVGVLLGASGVSDRVLSAAVSESEDLDGQVQRLTAERDVLAGSQRGAEEFAARIGPAAVRGLLEGKAVTLLTSGADQADRAAVLDLIGTAGAVVAGEVALTPAVGDPARSDQLRELAAQLLPAGAQLPAATDTGSLVGGLLGGVLSGPGAGQEAAEPVLAGLATAGFVAPGPP